MATRILLKILTVGAILFPTAWSDPTQMAQKRLVGKVGPREQEKSHLENEKGLPYYKNCQNMSMSASPNPCPDIVEKKLHSLREIEAIASTLQAQQSQNFQAKLQKRIEGVVKSKIFQIRKLKACNSKDLNWFISRKLDWGEAKEVCKKQLEEILHNVEKNWSPMRINLALSQPLVKEDRIIAQRSSWFDNKPSHFISDFARLPRLTSEETKQAENLYLENISSVPLKHFTPNQLKKMLKERTLYKEIPQNNGFLSSQEEEQLLNQQRDFQQQARNQYLEIMNNVPLLGHLKSGTPNEAELDDALSEIEKKLNNFLKKVSRPSPDIGLLLSFEPLVEELLQENNNYCHIAENARLKEVKSDRFKNYAMMGAGVLSAISCFIPGPVGASVCLTASLALSGWGYHEAASAKQDSLGQVLTGKEFETIAELDQKAREEFLAKIVFPLAAWGTTAVPARAASTGIKRIVSNIKSGDKTLPNLSTQISKQKNRLLISYNTLLKQKSPEEQNIIMQAILGMEGKGFQKDTIIKKISMAIGRCRTK